MRPESARPNHAAGSPALTPPYADLAPRWLKPRGVGASRQLAAGARRARRSCYPRSWRACRRFSWRARDRRLLGGSCWTESHPRARQMPGRRSPPRRMRAAGTFHLDLRSICQTLGARSRVPGGGLDTGSRCETDFLAAGRRATRSEPRANQLCTASPTVRMQRNRSGVVQLKHLIRMDVNHEQGQRDLVAPRAVPFPQQLLAEVAPVVQSGEPVLEHASPSSMRLVHSSRCCFCSSWCSAWTHICADDVAPYGSGPG